MKELIVISSTEPTSLAEKYAAGGMDKLAAELEKETYIKAASAQRKVKDKGKAKAKGKRMGKRVGNRESCSCRDYASKAKSICCACHTKATI